MVWLIAYSRLRMIFLCLMLYGRTGCGISMFGSIELQVGVVFL